MGLSSSSSQITNTIQTWCEANGVKVSFHNRRRGHPYALVSVGNQARKVTFSGSPSDQRAHMNALRDVKAVFRSLTKKAKQSIAKEQAMDRAPVNTPVNGNKRPYSKGAASPCVTTYKASSAPIPPQSVIDRGGLPRGNVNISQHEIEYRAARLDYALKREADGAKPAQIGKELSINGLTVSGAAVTSMIDRHMKAETPKAAKIEPSTETTIQPPAPSPEQSLSPTFVADLMAVVRKHTGELKAKADKWDAMVDLVKTA